MARRLVRFIGSVIGLAMVAGVPWLLAAVVRGPLSHRSVHEVRAALGRGELPAEVVVAVLTLVAGLAWLRVVVALAVEVVARAHHRPAPRVRGLGSGQRLAAVLVGGLTAVASVVPRFLVGESHRVHAQAIVEPELRLAPVTAGVGTVVVQRGDTLSGIAQAHLGSQAAWPEIWERNRGREFAGRAFDDPHLILPGWELYLPAPELAVEVAAPVVALPEPAAPPPVAVAPTSVPPTTVPPTTVPPTPAAPAIEAPAAIASTPPGEACEPGPDEVERPHLPSDRDFPVPAGAAVLLAAGAIGLVESLRRRQQRRAAVGARFAEPPETVRATEQVLRNLGSAEAVARLDVGLRAAAATLAHPSVASPPARVLAVLASPDGRLELVLSDPAAPAPPFASGDQADRWVLPAAVDLPELAPYARSSAMPCPSLVGVGVVRGAQLFIDLEGWGTLGVDASRERAALLIRSLAAELAVSPVAEGVEIAAVGLSELGELPRVTHHPDIDVAFEAAVTETTAVRVAAHQHGSTFALRARADGESWDPTVVVTVDDQLPEVAPGEGLAVIRRGRPSRGCWLTERDGSWWFEPLGLPIVPAGAALDELAAIRALLDQAAAPAVAEVAAEPVEPAVYEVEEAPWELMVRLLGPPDVVSADGRTASFERSKSLELVVWLSQHRTRATRTGARTALWDAAVQSATFANVVSDARRGLARCVPPPEGEEWIARTLNEELPLHRLVTTDAEVVAARVRRAATQADAAAIETLRSAVELVRGMPLEGTMYHWADAEGLSSNLVMLAVSATGELARRCLEVGDVEGVLVATARGLQVLPGHEELLALRMRAHARAGDLKGLRAEWAAYERVLASDPWADDPSERLVALRQELVAALAHPPSSV